MKIYLYLSGILLILALVLQYLDLSMGTTFDSWNIICGIAVAFNTIVLMLLSLGYNPKDRGILFLAGSYLILLIIYYVNPIRNSIVLPRGELIIECRSEHGGNCWQRIYLYTNNEYVYSSGCFGSDALEIGTFYLKEKGVGFLRSKFGGFDKQGVFYLNKGGIRLMQEDKWEQYQTIAINEEEFEFLIMEEGR